MLYDGKSITFGTVYIHYTVVQEKQLAAYQHVPQGKYVYDTHNNYSCEEQTF